MMNKRLAAIAAIFFALCCTAASQTSAIRSIFPLKEGTALSYILYDNSGKKEATYVMNVKNSKGNLQNGSLDIVYNCYDNESKAFFNSPNEFVMKVTKTNGKTDISMKDVLKLTKLQDIIPVGDFSAVPVDMTVGEKLANSVINIKIDKIKATVTVTDKSVNDHKKITVKAGTFDCWLVHENTKTKTPFSTSFQSADTWYSEGAGCVKQTVYDSKGKVKCRLELTNVK